MAVQAPFPQEITRRQGLEGTSGDHLVYPPAPRQEQQYLHQSSQMFVCLVSGTAHWLGSVPRRWENWLSSNYLASSSVSLTQHFSAPGNLRTSAFHAGRAELSCFKSYHPYFNLMWLTTPQSGQLTRNGVEVTTPQTSLGSYLCDCSSCQAPVNPNPNP